MIKAMITITRPRKMSTLDSRAAAACELLVWDAGNAAAFAIICIYMHIG